MTIVVAKIRADLPSSNLGIWTTTTTSHKHGCLNAPQISHAIRAGASLVQDFKANNSPLVEAQFLLDSHAICNLQPSREGNYTRPASHVSC